MPSADSQRTAPREDERIGARDLGEWRSRAGRLVVRVLARVARVLGHLLRWSTANVALVITVGVGLALVWSFASVSAEVYENVVDRDGIAQVDQPVLDAAVRLRTPASADLVTDFTDLGGTVGMPVIAVVAAGGLAPAWRGWTPVVLMAVASAGSLLMTLTGKEVTGRARPPQALAVPPYETSASFCPACSSATTGSPTSSRCAVGLGWLASVITGHRVRITLERRRRARGQGRVPDTTSISHGPTKPSGPSN